MEGIKIAKSGSYLDKYKVSSHELSLLEHGDGVEIMLQTVYENNIFYIYPSENKEVMEFFYILNGELQGEVEGRKINLKANDYFSAKKLSSPVHFTANSDTRYLWVITEPTFKNVSDYIKKLKDIVYTVERKDRYTYMHSKRVAHYTVKVAQKLNLNKQQLEDAHLAAELHDVGKISIPEEILNKPGKLTTREFDLIKKHPGEGADMVGKTYYKDLAPIIIQHHERLDGSGYPYGLTGEEISLEAKIIAVCDTFDAMTEDRTYRKAFPAEYAIEEIKSLVGIHYEPEIVSVFEEVLKEEGKLI
ncbi:HDIG domain-containing protein [Thalassobacillus cyri]|uniref:HDIG domain-containing protein n=1 Tax=Thalassobacillus cyri TaxID=571932 RepID=A0A1H3Z6N2_9BACI|nr:HD-GYP domain-containing protein [Thalassobacillus cyri]SEA18942.1 HDIG domain-containing protein [Thalassobacillus cyri]